MYTPGRRRQPPGPLRLRPAAGRKAAATQRIDDAIPGAGGSWGRAWRQPEDLPNDEQIEAVLDEFEETAWAGPEPDR